MQPLPDVLSFVSLGFEQNKIPCLLIGGFAVNVYQFSRETKDIDFIISEKDLEKAKEVLNQSGYEVFYQTDMFARFNTPDRSKMTVDLILVDQETLAELLKHGKEVSVGGKKFVVPSLNHLIALKLHAIKNNPKREYGDLLDILSLADKNNLDVSTPAFQELCLKYGTAEILNKIILLKGK